MTEQQEHALAEGLRALAATTRHASASRAVEAEVLAGMRRQPARMPVRAGRAWISVAAALLIAVGAGVWISRTPGATAPAAIVPGGFVDLPGASALPPMESGAIVRVALPVAALPLYGIQIRPDFGSEEVEMDLLIAQDGLPRAIRFADDAETRSTP